DLVGVDVAAVDRQRRTVDDADGLHQLRSSGVEKWPAMAVAAATAGLTRCVRPPLPWRPSKLRLLVLALRSPGFSVSGFIPRHMEHPAPRHSNPARSNTTSRPSASACCFTANEPGTTRARRPSDTERPATTPAATRRSSIRE